MQHMDVGLIAVVVVVVLAGSVMPAATAIAQTRAAAEAAPLDPDRISAVAAMLPAQPKGLGEPISNRAAWEALARTEGGRFIVARAEQIRTRALPEITDELYLDFSRTGQRNAWQRVAFDRRGRIGVLAMAECLQNEGRFLPVLNALIASLCEEKTWVLPAHDRDLTNFKGTGISIDLASSALAWQLATADWLVGEKLESATRQRMRDLIHQRVLAPYREMYSGRAPYAWLKATHNWNAVCLAGVTGAALIEIDSPRDRAEYIVSAEQYSKNFLAGFVGGYCTEGLGYWNYGFGHYALLSELVRRATGGQVDLLKRPEALAPAQFGRGIQIINGVAPAFADCSTTAVPDPMILWLVGNRLGVGLPQDRTLELKRAAAETGWGTGDVAWALIVAFADFASPAAEAAQPVASMPIRTWFDQAGILIGRPGIDSACRMGVALKGGNNAENHNHNDLGSFVVVVGNVPVVLDPGSENYTARTFSPQRYDSKMLNSFGHSVPVVAGQLQQPGAKSVAKILATQFTERQDRLEMDIRSAYSVPDLQKLVRQFVYSREGEGSLAVTDTVELSSPQTFGIALITAGKATQQPDGSILIEDRGQAVRVTIDTAGQPWTLHQEQINEVAAVHPWRLGIDLDQPVKRATITATIYPASPTPARK